jgi:hypothetical protein
LRPGTQLASIVVSSWGGPTRHRPDTTSAPCTSISTPAFWRKRDPSPHHPVTSGLGWFRRDVSFWFGAVGARIWALRGGSSAWLVVSSRGVCSRHEGPRRELPRSRSCGPSCAGPGRSGTPAQRTRLPRWRR